MISTALSLLRGHKFASDDDAKKAVNDVAENDERYELDATILFTIINNSTCFGHLYAHLQEYRLYVTAYGVQHCKRELV